VAGAPCAGTPLFCLRAADSLNSARGWRRPAT